MSKQDKLTLVQKKELIKLSAEIEAEAIKMRMDYEEHPSQESGSVVFVNEQSSLLENEDEELGSQALVSSSQILAKEIKKQKKKNGDKK